MRYGRQYHLPRTGIAEPLGVLVSGGCLVAVVDLLGRVADAPGRVLNDVMELLARISTQAVRRNVQAYS